MPVKARVTIHGRGPAIWPAWYPEAKLLETRADVGPAVFDALFQQDPVAATGGLFLDEWWQRYVGPPPPAVRSVITVDSSFGGSVAGDYSVFALWSLVPDGHIYLVDRWRGRVSLPELLR